MSAGYYVHTENHTVYCILHNTSMLFLFWPIFPNAILPNCILCSIHCILPKLYYFIKIKYIYIAVKQFVCLSEYYRCLAMTFMLNI